MKSLKLKKKNSILDNSVVGDVIMENMDSKHEDIFNENEDSTNNLSFDEMVRARKQIYDFIEKRKNKYKNVINPEEQINSIDIMLKHSKAIEKFMGDVDVSAKKELLYSIVGEYWDDINNFNKSYKFLRDKHMITLPLHYRALRLAESGVHLVGKVLPFLSKLSHTKKLPH